MKKCPFCKAEIEDNARFCLYCMTSLDQKQKIPPLKATKKRWLILTAAVLVFVLVVVAVSAPRGKVPVGSNGSDFSEAETSSFKETSASSGIETLSSGTSLEQENTNSGSFGASSFISSDTLEDVSENSSSLSSSSSQSTSSGPINSNLASSGNQSSSNVTTTSSVITNTSSNITTTSSTTTTTSSKVSTSTSSKATASTTTSSKASTSSKITSSSTSTSSKTTTTSSQAPQGAITGENYFTYKIYGSTAAITGVKNIPSGANLIIPSTLGGCRVTSIGKEAFENSPNWLSSVTIPDSITSIGQYAFDVRIDKIYINDISAWMNVDIHYNSGSCPFYRGTSELYINNMRIEDLYIPSGVTQVGNLHGCSSVRRIFIPKSVTKITALGIYECENLTDIYYEGSSSDLSIGYPNSSNVTWHYNYSF